MTQHGFIKKRFSLTNLLEFIEIITNCIDQGLPIDAIYLDFQKAFDQEPHKRLMFKVKASVLQVQFLFGSRIGCRTEYKE
jgi:hypothetical protein